MVSNFEFTKNKTSKRQIVFQLRKYICKAHNDKDFEIQFSGPVTKEKRKWKRALSSFHCVYFTLKSESTHTGLHAHKQASDANRTSSVPLAMSINLKTLTNK
ncbi:hypothetical protein FQA47_011235 [Oryzias melastigma]|uniref:Uncharacterized protein n=1 Tax=Oryzias melastigma TaxID=30732 RepID=A0A834CQK1_ORYME|nr:hypothetical protein FQA47_011235 [Oryzias melastigma]